MLYCTILVLKLSLNKVPIWYNKHKGEIMKKEDAIIFLKSLHAKENNLKRDLFNHDKIKMIEDIRADFLRAWRSGQIVHST